MLERHRLPGFKREPGLRLRVRRKDRLPDITALPADTRVQPQRLAPRLQSQNMAVLELKRLRHEQDHLIQQGGDVVAHYGELAQGGHDGLLEGSVEEGLFRPLTLFDALIERLRHTIKRLGQLPQFAPLAR